MSNMKKSKDLWFCAFLKMKGIDPVDYENISSYKGEWVFNISDEDWKKYKLEFSKSDISKIKWEMEVLKDMIY